MHHDSRWNQRWRYHDQTIPTPQERENVNEVFYLLSRSPHPFAERTGNSVFGKRASFRLYENRNALRSFALPDRCSHGMPPNLVVDGPTEALQHNHVSTPDPSHLNRGPQVPADPQIPWFPSTNTHIYIYICVCIPSAQQLSRGILWW